MAIACKQFKLGVKSWRRKMWETSFLSQFSEHICVSEFWWKPALGYDSSTV